MKTNVRQALATADKFLGGKHSVRILSDASVDVQTSSTGLMALDYILGRGLPRGRIIEIFGPESSGKTTIALKCIAQIQKGGGVAGLVDVEHATDPSWAERHGVNLDDLLFSQPDSAEEALDTAVALSRACSIVVVDSAAALVPLAELEGDMGDQQMGLQARLLGKAMRKMIPILKKNQCTVIFINQIRHKVGRAAMFGNPETTPGGWALRFAASVRIEVRHHKAEKGITGKVCGIKAVKNKVGPPFRKAELVITEDGFDKGFDLATVGEELGIIERSGKSYSFQDKALASSYGRLLSSLRKKGKHIRKAIRKELGGNDGSQSTKTVSSRKSRKKVGLF